MKTETQKNIEGTARPDRVPGTDVLQYLERLPNPARQYQLDKEGKKWFRLIGTMLVDTKKLAGLDIPNLVLLANAWAQYSWASDQINIKNSVEMGKGFVQTYKTGATNITTEYKLRADAEDRILKISKLFGMSFRDRHSLTGFFEDNSGQLDLFGGLSELHPDNKNYNLKVVGG
jgi:phage terminase small subunit